MHVCDSCSLINVSEKPTNGCFNFTNESLHFILKNDVFSVRVLPMIQLFLSCYLLIVTGLYEMRHRHGSDTANINRLTFV